MNESGRGSNNRRRSSRRREKSTDSWVKEGRKNQGRPCPEKTKRTLVERPQWTVPKLGTTPLPKPECPYCQKIIQDIASAITDPASGQAVHFDCARERIAESEHLGPGESITYIGGGRFGIVSIPNIGDPKHFQIKKTMQWEPKDQRAPWRRIVADNFSTT